MRTPATICQCGLVKRSKAGITISGDKEVCNSCGLPVTPDGSSYVDNPTIALANVTTLQGIPGFRITRVLGVVTELAATSGFTANAKGNSALDSGMTALRHNAKTMGANSIVGLTSSTFSAGGGITSAFGGDAVGVLLMGTAVIVEALADGGYGGS